MKRTPGREESCEGKQKFDTQALARRTADRINRNGGRVRVYRCVVCDGWHLGGVSRPRA